MSSQQFCKLNFLSSTERRFYTRKKPSHELFTNDNRISKALKLFNSSSAIKKINKYQLLKTEPNQKIHQDITFNQPQFIKRQLKTKIELLLKRSDKKWKQVFGAYEDLKSCTSKQTFSLQQNKFLMGFGDLLKQITEQTRSNVHLMKASTKQSIQTLKSNDGRKINLEQIKLIKENEILRRNFYQISLKNPQYRQSSFGQSVNSFSAQQRQQKQDCRQQCEQVTRQKIKINQLNESLYTIQNQNIKLKQGLVISEDSLRLLKEDKNQLSKKNDELKSQNQNLCAEMVRLRLQNENSNLKVERWRSVIAFQRQEISSFQSQLISIKNQYKDLMRKYKLLVKRLNTITSNNQSCVGATGFSVIRTSQHVTSKYYQTFKEQLQAFTKIRSAFNNKESENNLDKSNIVTDKRHTNTSTSDTYRSFLNEKQTFSNPTAIKKLSRQHYAYFKPNFYNFVQTYMDMHGIDATNIEQLSGGFDLNCDFLTTLRAILDSKFNEFLNENFTRTSSLSSFTYAWLSRYKIHRKQKKITLIKGDLDKEVIPTFFMNLMSQKLNYNWEIITFREFLMESLTLDELYFYLMTRNYIFQGGLLQNISGVYQEIYHIPIAQAQNLLQKFITDSNFRKKVEDYLRRFIVYVRKRPLIDVHFVLRILLEYYQSKKHQQFLNLGSLVQLLSKEKINNFTFQSFLRIFQYNFAYLSMTEKLQIYRKAFSCSRGKINLESILTVITEEGYLCKQVKKIFCNDQITIIKDQNKAGDESFTITPEFPELLNFQSFFQKFYKESYEQINRNMGLEHLDKNMQLIKEFNQTNIFQRIELIFSLCLSTMKKCFYTKKISLVKFLPILQQSVQMLKTFSKMSCQKKITMDLMINFKRETAAKKILRFYRKKRNQMHRNFIFGVKDQAIEEDEKMQGIRKEFNLMIQNLKEKFTTKKIGHQEK